MESYRFDKGPIEAVSWGRFVINGQEHAKKADGTRLGVGKDICLIGTQLSPWSERKGHYLTIDMVQSVVEQNIDTLIIGNGFNGALEVPAEVRRFVESKGIELLVAPTPKACALFNELFLKGKKVALLAHGTC